MEGFDLDKRLAQLESLGDPLPRLNQVVDWEAFRPLLMTIRRKPAKGPGGRPAYDVVLMFKVLVLQQLYNLADEQTEYQIRDRYSFCRFLGLSPVSKVPDARTIWVFREALKQHDLVDQLFIRLNELITAAGYIARRGQIVDASIVAVPRQRNGRQDNCKHKLIRRFEVTAASVADNQVFSAVVDPDNTGAAIWADAAYRSKGCERALKGAGYSYQRTSQQVDLSLSATSQSQTFKDALPG